MSQSLAALALGCSMAARADVWGHVDETGTARISSKQIDDRYQLFFKGRTTLEARDTAAIAETLARAAFERTPAFQRLLDHRNAGRFEPLIDHFARLELLEPALVKGIIPVESSFESAAVSAKGAIGLMQIIPETGERYGVTGDAKRTVEEKLHDPAINLRVGTRYLHDLLELFADDVDLALAAYNAGEKTVMRHGNTIPPFAETREYVKPVQRFRSFHSPSSPVPPKPIRIVNPVRRGPLVLSGDGAQ